MKNLTIISAACLIFAVACKENKTSESKKDMDVTPPKAEKIAKSRSIASEFSKAPFGRWRHLRPG